MSDDDMNAKPDTAKPDTAKPDTAKPDTAKPAKQPRSQAENSEMLEELERWSASLAAELGIDDVEVDIDAVLALAGVAAHAVLRPAAPLTTYLVGYAAGRAAALEGLSPAQAAGRASDIAADLARRHQK